MAEKKTGAVLELFALFDRHTGKSPRTKRAHVQGLWDLLRATIRGGLRWELDDATEIQRRFQWVRGQYRFVVDEGAYSWALEADNLSAAKSIEKLLEREPWLWPSHSGTGESRHKENGRIGVRSQVWFEGDWWRVTSVFADRLTICWYGWDGQREVLKARRTLNRQGVVTLAENLLDPEYEPQVSELVIDALNRHRNIIRELPAEAEEATGTA